MQKTVFQNAMSDLFAEMGTTSTFKPTIGAQVEDCYILVEKSIDEQPGGFEGAVWQRTTTLECLASEVGREPSRGDRFVSGNDVYVVQKLLDQSDELEITYKMLVKRTVR